MTETERKIFEFRSSEALNEVYKKLKPLLKDGDYFIHIVISKKEPTTENWQNTIQIYNQGRLVTKEK